MSATTRRRRQHLLLLLPPSGFLCCALIFCLLQFLELEFAKLNAFDDTKVGPVPTEHVTVNDVIVVREFIAASPRKSTTAWEFYHYNAARSDKIGAFRALPDTRDHICTTRTYRVPARQTRVSVVIAFHNEARSALIRTIMSLYRRTAARHLHELILIDDCSDDVTLLPSLLRLPLPPFTHNFSAATVIRTRSTTQSLRRSAPPRLTIKSLRNARRAGVIASRNRGARLATGDFLLFLDSHCEVNIGWLEPLLERVGGAAAAAGDVVAVSPVLDTIDAASLEYVASSKNLMGGFDWNLHFHWIPRPQPQTRLRPTSTEQMSKKHAQQQHSQYRQQYGQKPRAINAQPHPDSSAEAFKSPTFSGGIFMISRIGFFKLNGFNPQLQLTQTNRKQMTAKEEV